VNAAARYLISLAQALARMSLYASGHPARVRAAQASFDQLRRLQAEDSRPVFSFLGREVVYGEQTLRDLADWDWAERLAAAGVQRIEFDGAVDDAEYQLFLDDVLARLNLPASNAPLVPRPPRPTPIRFGTIAVREDLALARPSGVDAEDRPEANPLTLPVDEEVGAIEWLHQEVRTARVLPVAEAELVVTSLATAMRTDQQMILPLLTLKEFDQYTATHALNVAVLSMGLAEALGLSSREVRGYGIAGLLHDLGKVKVPAELLRKPGALSSDERRIVQGHTVEGARLILEGSERQDLCAVVAFEHHIMIDGGGYPARHTRRDCHHASMLVHVCDVFDALRTHRPYRVALATDAIVHYIEKRAGIEFHPDIARAFLAMLRRTDIRPATAAVFDEETALAGAGTSQ
jgi:putative nucleotidyltransferase with HDIG domain